MKSQIFNLKISANAIDPTRIFESSKGRKFDIDFTYNLNIEKKVDCSVGLGYSHYSVESTSYSPGKGTINSKQIGDAIGFMLFLNFRVSDSSSTESRFFISPFVKVYTAPQYWKDDHLKDVYSEAGISFNGISISERRNYISYGFKVFATWIESRGFVGIGFELGFGRKNFKKTILPEGKRQPDSEQMD